MIMVIMVIMTTRGNINDYTIGIETVALMEKVALDIMMVIMIIKVIMTACTNSPAVLMDGLEEVDLPESVTGESRILYFYHFF